MSNFDIQMNDTDINKLANAIAMAQLELQLGGIDDELARRVENWPKAEKDAVLLAKTTNDRVKAYRENRISAQFTMEREAREDEQEQKRLEARRIERQEQDAATLERNQATHDANIAAWQAACVVARQEGRSEPPKPAAPPLTIEELGSATHAAHLKEVF